MNKIEAMKAVLDGKKVRHKTWGMKDYHVALNIDNLIYDSDCSQFNFNYYEFNDWELCEEPKKKELNQYPVIDIIKLSERIERLEKIVDKLEDACPNYWRNRK
jgi:hypothetical protein